EWLAKLRLAEGMRSRDGLGWHDPRLAAFDLQWSDIRPATSIYRKLRDAGAVRRLLSAQDVAEAVIEAPTDTRAYLRGEVIRKYGSAVAAAGWESLVLDDGQREHLLRLPLPEPEHGNKEHVGHLVAASPGIADLLSALGRAAN